MKIVIVLCMVLFASYAESSDLESYHNEIWCGEQGGEIGVWNSDIRIKRETVLLKKTPRARIRNFQLTAVSYTWHKPDLW